MRGRAWGARALAALLSATSVARAGSFACETRTKRSLTEIVVPFGDSANPHLPAFAVRVLPGEVVCLTGTRDGSGQLVKLKVVRSASDARRPVIRLELLREHTTELRLAHSSTRWLYYKALTVITSQDVAIPTSALPVRPEQRSLEIWDRGVRSALLYDFRFGEAPPVAPRPRTERDWSVTNLSATFGLWGGERRVRLDSLNRALARDGFGPLPYVAIEGGLDADFTIARLRAGVSLGAGGRTARHRATGAELSTWLSEVGFTLGFDLVRYEQLSAFVSTGILFGNLRVDHLPNATTFPDAKPWEDRVTFAHETWPLEVGTDYVVPFGRASATERWTLQLGVRLGWLEQLGGRWEVDDRSSRGITGPPLDLSGPRGRLVLGLGAQNGW